MNIFNFIKIAQKAGSVPQICTLLGVTQEDVWGWLEVNKVPDKYIPEIEKVESLIENFESLSPIERAIKLAGSQVALAKVCGATQSAVSRWAISGKIGPKYVLKIEKAFGISRHLLNPDVYPDE